MPDVKHMKWWGWGVEGVAFHHEDKPGFRPFVIEAVDLDVTVEPTARRCRWTRWTCREPMISDELVAELTGRGRPGQRGHHDDDRIVHTYGKSVRDLLRLRAGDIPRVPDVVVYPGSEEEVQLVVDRAVAANAVLIPFGGGSNISGSLQAPPDETRPVISVDLGRMNRVLSVDEESGLARIQAGALGPDIEEQLGAHWAGPSATSRTASPTAPWAAGSRPGPRACSRTSTATSPTSPAGVRVVHAGQGAGAAAAAQHLDRTRASGR